jgi:hypothetical protein
MPEIKEGKGRKKTVAVTIFTFGKDVLGLNLN